MNAPLLARVRERLAEKVRVRVAQRRSGVEIASTVRLGAKVRISAVGAGRVRIGPCAQIGSGTTIVAADGAVIDIGHDVFMSHLCLIAANDRIEIGDETMLAEMVVIRDHDHDPDRPPRSGATLTQPVSIGARVWLGSKSSVVRGGSVGDDSVVGAHGLVNRPVPERSLAAGVPARVVRGLHKS